MNERWSRVKELFTEGAGLPTVARQAWIDAACGGDAALRAEVEALLRAHDQAGDFMAAPALAREAAAAAVIEAVGAAAGPALPQRCGAYRIVRELGRGGMGVVYLGLRDDALFDKAVAIKIVSSDRVHHAVFQRFQEERRILASLDHPNIARLLDAGTTGSGVAYVVMEYVAGEVLDEYCSQRRLAVRERLDLFVQVCAAVQYSHQQLVVHRDIKARNILVTAEGVPKLLDFGIAKLLEPGRDADDATRTAFRALTPESASPEQVRGDAVTVASDVYSLGVLLYRLLAERSPYRGDLGTQAGLVRAVCEEEPVRPSEAAGRQELRGDLDLITLKALRKDPLRRYASVEQLAEDVRRHLERRPILAAPDAWTYRARKFAARHWVGLSAGAAFVLALAAGGAATLWQARRAERRFNDVRRLAHTFMFDVHDSVEKLPGSIAARKLLVTEALSYLDSLAREAGGDASLQRELASGYEKMADVLGRPNYPNLGDLQGAMAAYRKAQAARELLLAADPRSVEVRRDLSTTSLKLGYVLFHTGVPKAGAEEARKATVIEEALSSTDKTPAQALRLGTSYAMHGYLLAASGCHPSSPGRLREAVALLEPLRSAGWRPEEALPQLGFAYGSLGDYLSSCPAGPGLGPDVRASLEPYRKSAELDQALARVDPVRWQRRVFVAWIQVGDVLVQLAERPSALEHYRRSLELGEKLAATDRDNRQAQSDLALACERTGTVLAQEGQAEEAFRMLDRAASLLEPVFARDSTNVATRSRIANCSIGRGHAHAALGARRGLAREVRLAHWRAARARFEEGRAFWAEMRDTGVTTGVEAQKPDVLAGEIAKCDAALAAMRR